MITVNEKEAMNWKRRRRVYERVQSKEMDG